MGSSQIWGISNSRSYIFIRQNSQDKIQFRNYVKITSTSSESSGRKHIRRLFLHDLLDELHLAVWTVGMRQICLTVLCWYKVNSLVAHFEDASITRRAHCLSRCVSQQHRWWCVWYWGPESAAPLLLAYLIEDASSSLFCAFFCAFFGSPLQKCKERGSTLSSRISPFRHTPTYWEEQQIEETILLISA